MFDITQESATETGTVELRRGDESPMLDGAGNPLSVTVHGPGSKPYAEASARRANRITDKMRRKGGKFTQTADEKAAEEADFLADITISFNGWSHPAADGKSGRAAFHAAYSDRKIGFIADQVTEFVNDWGNFTRGSATS